MMYLLIIYFFELYHKYFAIQLLNYFKCNIRNEYNKNVSYYIQILSHLFMIFQGVKIKDNIILYIQSSIIFT